MAWVDGKFQGRGQDKVLEKVYKDLDKVPVQGKVVQVQGKGKGKEVQVPEEGKVPDRVAQVEGRADMAQVDMDGQSERQPGIDTSIHVTTQVKSRECHLKNIY